MEDFGFNLKKSCDFILHILSIPVNFFSSLTVCIAMIKVLAQKA